MGMINTLDRRVPYVTEIRSNRVERSNAVAQPCAAFPDRLPDFNAFVQRVNAIGRIDPDCENANDDRYGEDRGGF